MRSTLLNVLVLALMCILCKAEEHPKRVPTGFTGTRGKKSISYPLDDTVPVNTIDKRAPSGFMGMRGKKPYPVWEGTYPDAVASGTDVDKRAPSGFMGMRGKKDYEIYNYGPDYLKRAPSGFMGMRGKKDDDDEELYEKRAPMGFVGMRGKKEWDLWDDSDKRAPSGFFGMRGKKQPRQSGFFGMRGKKYPYEFRGKFVGVRGKKSNEPNAIPLYDSYETNNIDLSTVGQDLDMHQLMLLLTENQEKDAGVGANAIWNLPPEYSQ